MSTMSATPQEASSGDGASDDARDDDLDARDAQLPEAERAHATSHDIQEHDEHEAVEDDVAACDAHESQGTKTGNGDNAGEDHVEHDLHEGEHEIADGDGLEVLERRVGTVDEHVAGVERQGEGPSAQEFGDGLDVGGGELAGGVQADELVGAYEEHGRHGDDEQAGGTQPQVEVAFEAHRVTVRHAVAHLGEQCCGKRDAQDAVGELVPHPRIAHGRGAVGRDVQGTRVHERERDEVDGRAEDGGKRESQRLVQALVVQVDMEAEPESRLDERGYLHACHHGDGNRRADGEQQ